MAASRVFARSLWRIPGHSRKASPRSLQHIGLGHSRQYSQIDQESATTTYKPDGTRPINNSVNVFRKIVSPIFTKVLSENTPLWNNSKNFSVPFHNDSAYVEYRLPDGLAVTSRSWLRDACNCERCIDPHSGQKRFPSSDVPFQLPIERIKETEDGSLQIFWKDDFFTHDIHVSTYPVSLWQPPEPGFSLPVKIPGIELWTQSKLAHASPFFSHESLMTDGPEYRKLISTLCRLGIVILQGVPSSEDAVLKMAERVGVVQDSFYGRAWDVVAKPNAENVAYTSSALDLHQDLLYMYNIPRIQILHCLKNSVSGGESIFTDGFAAAFRFRQQYPDLTKAVKTRRVVYSYNKGGNIYRQPRSMLSKMGIFWSPLFQDPVQLDAMTMEGMLRYTYWLKGVRLLREILEEPLSVFEYKLGPGECVIFDNRRVLHGRRAFEGTSGERWLRGAYIENDSYISKLMSLDIVPFKIRGPEPKTADFRRPLNDHEKESENADWFDFSEE